MQEWHSDALFNKAKCYIELAFEADRRSYTFPLLAAIALELLGKSALAKIHPALIADPRGEGRSIHYAFGVPQKPDGVGPQTIVAKTVFSRLEELIPNFTEDDRKHCIGLSERRNREVHTGEFAYEGYGSGNWLPGLFRVVLILCDFLGREPTHLLGAALATEAIQTTDIVAKAVRTQVLDAIAKCKKTVSRLSREDLRTRKTNEPEHDTYLRGGIAKKAPCPACESFGRLAAKDIGERPAQALDGKIYVETNYSPRHFKCGVCDLELNSVAELQVAGLADHFSETNEYDPADYFDIKTYEPNDDYGNE